MVNINAAPETKGLNFYFCDIAVCRGIDRLIFFLIGAAIQPHVVMIGTQFAEVGRNADGCSYGPLKIMLRVIFCGKYLCTSPERKNDQQNKKKNRDIFFYENVQVEILCTKVGFKRESFFLGSKFMILLQETSFK